MSDFKFQVPTVTSPLDIELNSGQTLFVLGANGTGKSSLMHLIYSRNAARTKRILAHRQTWFSTNTMSTTAAQKQQTEQQMRNSDTAYTSRWKDDYNTLRTNYSIFDLIFSENIRARNITAEVDKEDLQSAKRLASIQSPIQAINELFAISNIPIVITLEKDDQLFASKNGSIPYSIAELSDGERNALLICADILTVPPGFLIILDEPERHLHRSIISPLLSSLFQKRKDCAFIISTHDILLPLDHLDANILLLRGCVWHGQRVQSWDLNLVMNTDNIPDYMKKEIIGSKRDILFVEGESRSLDKQIYQLIFPSVTVISQGNCSQVEKSVTGIKETANLHWINVFGLIDADDRTPEQIQTLLQRGIAALTCYSVESLYYNLEVIRKIANRYADILGHNADEIYTTAISNITKDLSEHKERLCAKLCEKRVRTEIMSKLPKYKDILEKQSHRTDFDLEHILNKEELIFDKLVADDDIQGLINRYPIRETQLINNVLKAFNLPRDKYESAVRKLIIDDKDIKNHLKGLLNPLTNLIDGNTTT